MTEKESLNFLTGFYSHYDYYMITIDLFNVFFKKKNVKSLLVDGFYLNFVKKVEFILKENAQFLSLCNPKIVG